MVSERVRACLITWVALALLGAETRAQEVPLRCEPQGSRDQLAQRPSPYDSVVVRVGNGDAKICYSRPLARGRVIFGDLVPYDMLWRTGANEPTIIHLPFSAEIAGITVGPGKYSIYTVPSTREWVVVVNASTSQGGLTRDEGQFQNQYVPEVRAQEVGRGLVMNESTGESVEQFTIRSEQTGNSSANIVLEWERTRVRIPVRANSAPR